MLIGFFFHESDRKLGVSSRKSGSNIMLSKAYQKSHPSLIPALFFLSTILFVFRLNKHDKTLNLMPWNKMAHGTGSGWRGWRWGWGVLFQLGAKQSHFHTQHRRHVCGKMYSHQSVTVNMGCLQGGAVRWHERWAANNKTLGQRHTNAVAHSIQRSCSPSAYAFTATLRGS